MPAHAGRWVTTKGLTIDTDTTSNVGLDRVDRESDTVLRIRPSLGLKRRGGRISMRMIYAPEARFYLQGTNSDHLWHRLRLTADAELVKNIFFLRIKANAGQALIDPASRVGFDSINNPDAFTQSFSLRIIPDLRIPLMRGEFARIRIRPGINYTVTADSAGGEGGINRGGSTTVVSVTSGNYFARMPWSLDYRNDVFDVDSDDNWGRASGTLGYRFDERYTVRFTFGYDSFQSDRAVDSDRQGDGFRWRTTLEWNPGPRTAVTLGIGEAFFGDDWVFNFRHRHKHTAIRASYYKNIEDVTTQLLDTEFIPFEDAFGNEILDPVTGQQLGVEVGTPALVNDVYLLERFRVSLTQGRGRTTATLNVRYDNRDYASSNLDSVDAVGDVILRRSLTPKTTGDLRLKYWDHREDHPDGQDFDEYSARVGFRYRVAERTTIGLYYIYTERTSNIPAQNFDEGRINLRLGISL